MSCEGLDWPRFSEGLIIHFILLVRGRLSAALQLVCRSLRFVVCWFELQYLIIISVLIDLNSCGNTLGERERQREINKNIFIT